MSDAGSHAQPDLRSEPAGITDVDTLCLYSKLQHDAVKTVDERELG